MEAETLKALIVFLTHCGDLPEINIQIANQPVCSGTLQVRSPEGDQAIVDGFVSSVDAPVGLNMCFRYIRTLL